MEESAIKKIIGMFRPYHDEKFSFLDEFPSSEVICGPNDRAVIGFDTYFPKAWLIEDHDFTPEEADWFISKVREIDDGKEQESK